MNVSCLLDGKEPHGARETRESEPVLSLPMPVTVEEFS
jgi:hypothetical protein